MKSLQVKITDEIRLSGRRCMVSSPGLPRERKTRCPELDHVSSAMCCLHELCLS